LSDAVVSFVIPVRDDGDRLRRCLTSISSGALEGEVEVVVADNGSADDSARVAESLGAHVLRLPGLRVPALRNRGAAGARADLLAFVDADHELGEGWVEAALDVMRDPSVGATGALCVPPTNGTWVQQTYGALRGRTTGRGDVEWLGSGNLVVRRRAFEAVGGFDETLEASEDVDLCRRLFDAGWRIVGDERLRNVHHGDPATLKQLFRSELWRGRDNLGVSLRAGLTLRSLPGVAFPIVQLGSVALVAVGLGGAGAGWGPVAWLGLAVLATTLLLRTAVIARRGQDFSLPFLARALAVAATYDGARALSLVLRARHHRK
jgi:hypothetical protein